MVERTFAELVRDLRMRRTNGERPPVLVLGAGASVDAGIGAMEELYKFFGVKDFDAFSNFIAPTSPAERYRYLADFLQKREPVQVTPGYQALATLCAQNYFDLVLTTNMDPLLDDALTAARPPLWRKDFLLLVNGVIRPDRLTLLLHSPSPRVKVVKLHGEVFQPFMAWTIGEMDAFLSEIAPSLKPALTSRDVLVVGHSLRDERIRDLAQTTGGDLWFTHPEKVPDHLTGNATMRVVVAPEAAFEKFFPALAHELLLDSLARSFAPRRTRRTPTTRDSASSASTAPVAPAQASSVDELDGMRSRCRRRGRRAQLDGVPPRRAACDRVRRLRRQAMDRRDQGALAPRARRPPFQDAGTPHESRTCVRTDAVGGTRCVASRRASAQRRSRKAGRRRPDRGRCRREDRCQHRGADGEHRDVRHHPTGRSSEGSGIPQRRDPRWIQRGAGGGPHDGRAGLHRRRQLGRSESAGLHVSQPSLGGLRDGPPRGAGKNAHQEPDETREARSRQRTVVEAVRPLTFRREVARGFGDFFRRDAMDTRDEERPESSRHATIASRTTDCPAAQPPPAIRRR